MRPCARLGSTACRPTFCAIRRPCTQHHFKALDSKALRQARRRTIPDKRTRNTPPNYVEIAWSNVLTGCRMPDTPTDSEQLLLNELNHRVKNSLQTVASVLRIQANHDEASRPALVEAALRVTAIARVHASLYRTRRGDAIGNY